MTIVLVGNKTDMETNRQVSWEEGSAFAKRNDLIFMETSAKTGANVDNMYLSSAKVIYDKINEGAYDLQDESLGIKPGNDPTKLTTNAHMKSN